jgi:formylglycine-generating enzyme required for sulfatase activity
MGRKTDVACSDKNPGLAEVRSYRPNVWMVHDMSGNVWEWVWDVYGEYPEEEITDPTGGVGGNTHVFRGGSWVFESNDARVTNRVRFDKNGRFTDLGVRLVRTAE